VLEQHEVRHAIFYGAKANKAQCLLGAAKASGIGVDVSSIYEMQAALRAGVPAAQLCATGPAKTEDFHRALVHAGALICVDSLEEFDHLKTLVEASSEAIKARVLLRYRPKACGASRFGMGAADLLVCLHLLTGLRAFFDFEGFHFHLGGYGFESRAQAFREVTDFVDVASDDGVGSDHDRYRRRFCPSAMSSHTPTSNFYKTTIRPVTITTSQYPSLITLTAAT